MDDERLVALTAAAAAGDRAAFEELLSYHLPDLRAFVRLQVDPALRQRESSADLVQSACREALAKADRFRFAEPEGFRRWLFTTALRKVRDRRDFHLAGKRDARREAGADEALQAAYASLTSPSGAAARREDLDTVERAMDALPDEYRQVILLSKVAGLTRTEVAAEMGRSEGSIRMLLHRALARLVAELEPPD